MIPDLLRPQVTSAAALAPLLAGPVPAVDAVGLEFRAGELAKRSLKREAKRWALRQAITLLDLTTLEGADTPGRVRALCAKARRPEPADDSIPPVAAVCVYPARVPDAIAALRGTQIAVASVATGFPSGLYPLAVRLEDVRHAVADGATEIDMVIDRSAFLAGEYGRVYDEVEQVRAVCGDAHLKVILETHELVTYDNVRLASALAMAAGAHFIKTSTGKLAVGATLPVALCMAEAIRDHAEATGRAVGLKVAGGVRTSKQAIQNMVIVHETLGPEWLVPARLRIGASALLNDILLQLRAQETGRYAAPYDVTLDK